MQIEGINTPATEGMPTQESYTCRDLWYHKLSNDNAPQLEGES